jgi:hypothetical protein
VELLLDKNGNGQIDDRENLAYTYGYSNNDASISSALGVGTYFIRVSYSSANTNYTLKVSAIATL